jgi:hypothetical protein
MKIGQTFKYGRLGQSDGAVGRREPVTCLAVLVHPAASRYIARRFISKSERRESNMEAFPVLVRLRRTSAKSPNVNTTNLRLGVTSWR